MMKPMRNIALAAFLAIAAGGCIEDDFTTSSSDLLEFSVDTLAFDTVFTGEGTPTMQFIVYNRHSKQINISSIAVAGESGATFYLNVDGVKGETFSDVEIRGKDSIYVFVEAYIDYTNDINPIEFVDHINFLTNGVTQQVALTAWGIDVTRLSAPQISQDTRYTADRPYLIYDTLRVDSGATLTIDPGTTLYFHDKAAMVIDGTLIVNGTQDAPVNLRGDRLDEVLTGVSYDIMSGQWGGVTFTASSFGNEMRYTYMRGSTDGVVADSCNVERRKLYLLNTILHNAVNSVITSSHAWIEAEGCEFSDAGGSVVKLTGGKARLVNCTIANYYLFSTISGTMLNLSYVFDEDSNGTDPLMDASFDNCIFYGNATDFNIGRFPDADVMVRYCLLKSDGYDDDNFINCVWAGDPNFYTERESYIFDYRLRDESDAIGMGNAEYISEEGMTDFYGTKRVHSDGTVDIGAYAWNSSEESDDDDNDDDDGGGGGGMGFDDGDPADEDEE